MKTISLFCLLFLLITLSIPANETLQLSAEDVVIDQSIPGGFLLRIRKKPGINSVLLTDSTKDPALISTTYGLRNPNYHPINGDEMRLLDGKPLVSERDLYFLADSAPHSDPIFGEAYHIFIPYVVEYGYPWTRHGELLVHDGVFLGIRTFERPYADYRGSFTDNPFLLRVSQAAASLPPEGDYLKDTVDIFRNIAGSTSGQVQFSSGEGDVLNQVEEVLRRSPGSSLDLVLAIDTTRSMRNDIPHLQSNLVPLLSRYASRYRSMRVGLVYYRDYGDAYLTRMVPFRTDLAQINEDLSAIQADGGSDVPEAVYEALYNALRQFPWQAESRQIILIGDAPPHSRPRGDVDRDKVYTESQRQQVALNTIILPQ